MYILKFISCVIFSGVRFAFVKFACSCGLINLYERFGFYVECKKYNGVNANFLLTILKRNTKI